MNQLNKLAALKTKILSNSLLNLLTLICLIIFFGITVGQAEQKSGSSPLVFRVGAYNVGHFNQGKLGGYQEDDVTEAAQRWKNWFVGKNYDLLFLSEWNEFFDKAEKHQAQELLLSETYPHISFGESRTWIMNGIAAKSPLKNFRTVELEHKMYYMYLADWQPRKDLTITLISVHIPWQEKFHAKALELFTQELGKYPYFICGGDLNAKDDEILKIRDAGFRIANGGDEGWFCTIAHKCGTTDKDVHIDNIITSPNLQIRKVGAPHTGLSDKDHHPLEAEVVVP